MEPMTRNLMRRRADADDDQVEMVLDLGSSLSVHGSEVVKAAGRLKFLYETEQLPDPLLDLMPARAAIKELDAAIKRYDQAIIAKARAGMARSAEGEFPEGDA